MTDYLPEPGQIFAGYGVARYDVPRYVEALLAAILAEFERVYWNVHQEILEVNSYRPGVTDSPVLDVPGLEIRGYWWGDEDSPQAHLPNLSYGGVHIFWYKHPGRGLSATLEQTPDEWVAWFDDVIAAINAAEPRW